MAVIGGLHPHHLQNTLILKRYQRNQECFRNGHSGNAASLGFAEGTTPILPKGFWRYGRVPIETKGHASPSALLVPKQSRQP